MLEDFEPTTSKFTITYPNSNYPQYYVGNQKVTLQEYLAAQAKARHCNSVLQAYDRNRPNCQEMV